MTLSLQRCVFCGILMIWGVLLSFFYLSGRVTSYLSPSFQIWTMVAGAALLIMAVAALLLPEEETQDHGDHHHHHDDHSHEHDHESEEGHDCGGHEGHAHTHARSPLRLAVMVAILVVPVVGAAIVSPDQFGPDAVRNRGYVNDIGQLPAYQPAQSVPADQSLEPPLPQADGSTAAATPATSDGSSPSYVPLNDKGQIKTEPVDLLYAVEDPSIRADFENKEIEMIGQYMPAQGNNADGKRFSLVKMFIVCCAADARPVAVAVENSSSTKVPEMSWIRVTGKATFPVEGGRPTPLIVADSVQTCDPPSDAFIYNN